jgi:hypothetical protein
MTRARGVVSSWDLPEDGPIERPSYEGIPRVIEGELSYWPSILGHTTVAIADPTVNDGYPIAVDPATVEAIEMTDWVPPDAVTVEVDRLVGEGRFDDALDRLQAPDVPVEVARWLGEMVLGVRSYTFGAAQFDPAFDFRTDATGPDPDSSSPTLRRYHKLLWSKPLPSGDRDRFDLDATKPGAYLHHLSPRGEFYLGSDAAMPTWTEWKRSQIRKVTEQIPESEREQFRTISYQMGGMMLFPNRQIDRKPTINQERGRNAKIADRLDLTVECIRLHYLRETSPMAETLIRYGDFFDLFDDFKGYVDFFLLQDLLSDDSSAVWFFMPFADFEQSPFPMTVEAYGDYRRSASSFIEARNRRMSDYVAGLDRTPYLQRWRGKGHPTT